MDLLLMIHYESYYVEGMISCILLCLQGSETPVLSHWIHPLVRYLGAPSVLRNFR